MDKARLRPAFALALAGAVIAAGASGCSRPDSIVIGATTSAYDSGLLEQLIRDFNIDHPQLEVRTVIAGSGEVLELGRRGDVDLLLVHAPEAEARFIEAGHAPRRRPFMENGFVIAGPPDDPAGIRGAESPARALSLIARGGHGFVSRGDSSGTHYREIALWAEAGVAPDGDWYIESGQGQATTLHVASERAAYVLTDDATFTVLSEILELTPLVEDHPSLRNVYSVLEPSRAIQA